MTAPVAEGAGDAEVEERQRRSARNQVLFREVNERVEKLYDGWPPMPTIDFVCECFDETCSSLVALTREQYEHVRASSLTFLTLPEHVDPVLEEVADRHPGFWTVRKLGAAVPLVQQTDPRLRRPT